MYVLFVGAGIFLVLAIMAALNYRWGARRWAIYNEIEKHQLAEIRFWSSGPTPQQIEAHHPPDLEPLLAELKRTAKAPITMRTA